MHLAIIISFLVGLGRYVEFYYFFRISVADIICVIALPITIPGILKYGNTRSFIIIISLLLILSFAKTGSNALNDLDGISYVRALAWPAMIFAALALFIKLLTITPKVIISYLIGVPFGAFYNYLRPEQFAKTQIYSNYEMFFFTLFPLLVSLALLFAVWIYRKSRLICLLPLLLIIVIFSSEMPRSTLLVFAIVLMMIISLQIAQGAFDKARARKHVLLLGAAATIMAGTMGYWGYVALAPHGILGAMHQDKYYAQASTSFGATPWGLLIGGRIQFLAGMLAVKDRPFVGHGTRNPTSNYYLLSAVNMAHGLGESNEAAILRKEDPFHSIVLGEWATGGILALGFWFYALYSHFYLCRWTLKWETSLTPWILWVCVDFAWDWLFSPLAMALRISLGIVFALYVMLRHDEYFKNEFLRFYSPNKLGFN